MKEKLIWFIAGGALLLIMSLGTGGIYTITSPNGTVDTAYKINRFTGQVWLIKTYAKQVGPLSVLTARQAEVEKTKSFGAADIPPLAMNQTAPTVRDGRSR